MAKNRRTQIEMTEPEIAEFLEAQKVAVVSTNGVRGWPHSMPLWYVVREGEIWAWTFRKSQKVKNIERDPRATVIVEDGEQYNELRGVMYESDVVMHIDPDVVTQFALDLTSRYYNVKGEDLAQAAESFSSQIPKRVVLQFKPQRTATWDHRKLGGVY